MDQIIVETTGSFMLIDRSLGYQEIASVGPTTVPLTAFVERKLREGQLQKVGDAEPLPEPEPKRAAKGRRGR